MLSRLPQEIRDDIMSYVLADYELAEERVEFDQEQLAWKIKPKSDNPARNPLYATIRPLQKATERIYFENLYLDDVDSLEDFKTIVNERRLRYLSTLTKVLSSKDLKLIPEFIDFLSNPDTGKRLIVRILGWEHDCILRLHLSEPHFVQIDAWDEGYIPKPETRADIAKVLQSLPAPNEATAHFPVHEHREYPVELRSEGGDPLGPSLRRWSYNASELEISGMFDCTLFQPANPESEPTPHWPRLRSLDVDMSVCTPHMTWYFDQGPYPTVKEVEPLFCAFAAALEGMPMLQVATLHFATCQNVRDGDQEYQWGVTYKKSEDGGSQLSFATLPWRPSKETEDLFHRLVSHQNVKYRNPVPTEACENRKKQDFCLTDDK